MIRLLLRLALVLVASLFTACSSFDAHWQDAAQGRNGATRWDGSWQSGQKVYSDGAYHHGRLRCVLEPVASAKSPEVVKGSIAKNDPHRLKAYFHANWLMFSGNYDIVLEPVPGKPHQYSGTHDLPAMFGGRYQYAATITDDHFNACYTCSIDKGVFDLHRVRSDKK
jgi:hypothetical protein